jgi:hypothetical protein
MNPSRDIEKLFDQYGGNAGDYQEIGRETEARTARTRWPLLATLDFSQPSIPGIAQRGPLLPANPLTQSQSATPISRGKPPLFARAHRRTIPPVANVTLPQAALGAARFSALAESVELQSETPEPPAATLPRVPEAVPAPPSARPPAAKASLPRIAAAVTAEPVTPEPVTPPARPAPASGSTSILGKMFQAQAEPPAAQPAPAAGSASLLSVFERLRAPAAAAPAVAGSWLASRTSRS